MRELKIFVLIMRENMLFSGEIFTTGTKVTLVQIVTVVTNLTSGAGCF